MTDQAPAPDPALDFEPVPRRARVDGWNPDAQRAFVKALVVTGSLRRAATVVGKSPSSVTGLLRAKGAERFRAACKAAMAIADEAGARRLASRLEAVEAVAEAKSKAAAQAEVEAGAEACARAPISAPTAYAPWNRSRSRGLPPPPEPEPEPSEAAEAALLARLVGKYLIKLAGERDARTAGRIVEADFLLRQLTHIEVMFDMLSGDGFAVLSDFRIGEHALVDIAETPMSRLLGEARRARWAELDAPPRPEPSASDLLVDHGRYSTQPPEHTRGGKKRDQDAQVQAFKDRHARDAQAQLEWEARARQDFENRRDSAT